MPELPEVETVRTGLAGSITGATADSIEILDERSLKRHQGGITDFVATLTGRKVLAVVRRGKFIWMPVEAKTTDPVGRPIALVGHLGMSGQMLVQPSDAPDERHLRVRFRLRGPEERQLRFVDQRMFGGLAFLLLAGELDGPLAGLGVALAQQRHDHLLDQTDLAVGGVAPDSQVPGLDAVTGELRRRPRHRERVDERLRRHIRGHARIVGEQA